jgi:hypothetical protein
MKINKSVRIDETKITCGKPSVPHHHRCLVGAAIVAQHHVSPFCENIAVNDTDLVRRRRASPLAPIRSVPGLVKEIIGSASGDKKAYLPPETPMYL